MTPCEKQTFIKITPAEFDCLVAQAAENGLPLNGNSGEASASGFTPRWNYDPAKQALEIQCVAAPFLVPCSMINAKISGLVRECAVSRDPGQGANPG